MLHFISIYLTVLQFTNCATFYINILKNNTLCYTLLQCTSVYYTVLHFPAALYSHVIHFTNCGATYCNLIHFTTLCYILLQCTTLFFTETFPTRLHCASIGWNVIYFTTTQFYTLLKCTNPYYTVLNFIVIYNTFLTVLYFTALGQFL